MVYLLCDSWKCSLKSDWSYYEGWLAQKATMLAFHLVVRPQAITMILNNIIHSVSAICQLVLIVVSQRRLFCELHCDLFMYSCLY